jgi:hypothetical protein
MTLLSAAALQSPSSSRNAAITADLGTYATDYWPPHQVDLGLQPSGTVVSPLPVIEHPTERGGCALRSYFDDFYFRIYITPTRLDLGNVVTAQTRSIVVWNAWPDQSRSLTDLQTTGADGIIATGEGALPLAFNPLQQRIWQINVDTSGPAVIDATLSWLFAGLDPVSVEITGNRLTAWTIPPRWHNGMLERLEWSTEVQQAADGNQDAYPLRDAPDRTWEFDVRVANADRWLLEAALYDWSARNWAFPVSPDHSMLAAPLPAASSSIPLDTAYLDYTLGGLAMLWSSPTVFELVEVDQIQANALLLVRPTVNTWPRGTRVYPVRIARLADRPQLQRPTSRRVDAHVRMTAVEACDWPAIPPAATYLGYPVLEQITEASTLPTAVYERQLEELNAGFGPVDIDDFTGLAWGRQSHAWKPYGRAERAALRSLFYYCNGRVNRLWVPTWQDDMQLLATVASASLVIDIAWCGYTRYLHGQPGRKQLRIELVGGAVFYRQVDNWAELDASTERLTLSAAFGQIVTPEQVAQISYMALCTLAGDAVEIQHEADSEGMAIVSTQFAQVPGNE